MLFGSLPGLMSIVSATAAVAHTKTAAIDINKINCVCAVFSLSDTKVLNRVLNGRVFIISSLLQSERGMY